MEINKNTIPEKGHPAFTEEEIIRNEAWHGVEEKELAKEGTTALAEGVEKREVSSVEALRWIEEQGQQFRQEILDKLQKASGSFDLDLSTVEKVKQDLGIEQQLEQIEGETDGAIIEASGAVHASREGTEQGSSQKETDKKSPGLERLDREVAVRRQVKEERQQWMHKEDNPNWQYFKKELGQKGIQPNTPEEEAYFAQIDRQVVNALLAKSEGIERKAETASEKSAEEGLPKVRVRRTSGEVEDDWSYVGSQEGNAVVMKRDPEGQGGWMKKVIPQAELDALNPTEGKENADIESSEDITQQLTPEKVHAAVLAEKPIEVKIQRSSGEMESGWRVTGIDGAEAVVIKFVEGGKFLSKAVPLEELKAWNAVGMEQQKGKEDAKIEQVITREQTVLDSGYIPAQEKNSTREQIQKEIDSVSTDASLNTLEKNKRLIALDRKLESISVPKEGEKTFESKENQKQIEDIAFDMYEKRINGGPKAWDYVDALLAENGIAPFTPEAEEFMRKWDWQAAKNMIHNGELRAEAREEWDRSLGARLQRDPYATPEELDAGTYKEFIEFQVRDAVMALRKKGYNTFESGFHESIKDDQYIGFYKTEGDTLVIDAEDMNRRLSEKGIKVEFSEEDDRYTLALIPNKPVSLQEWKEIWDQVADAIPDKGKPAAPSAGFTGPEWFRKSQEKLRAGADTYLGGKWFFKDGKVINKEVGV